MSLAERCRPARDAHHRELARDLEGIPRVESVDRIPASETPTSHAETEIVAEKTKFGAVPNSVLFAILMMGLSVARVCDHNHPDYVWILVR